MHPQLHSSFSSPLITARALDQALGEGIPEHRYSSRSLYNSPRILAIAAARGLLVMVNPNLLQRLPSSLGSLAHTDIVLEVRHAVDVPLLHPRKHLSC
jgi:hypothetical protein